MYGRFNVVYATLMALLRGGVVFQGSEQLAAKLPENWELFAAQWEAIVPIIIVFIVEGLIYRFGNPVKDFFKGGSKLTAGMILVLLIPALALQGCAHSGIKLNEEMADGSKSNLSITDTTTLGKQSTLQNFSYTGQAAQGEIPWSLQAGQEVQHDTTQVLQLLRELLNVAAQIAPLYTPPPLPPAAPAP